MMRNCSAFFVYICSLSGLNLNTYTLCAFITIQQTFSFFTTYLLPMEKVHIENEIGRLRRVIIHNPGPEIEAMTPREANGICTTTLFHLPQSSGNTASYVIF